MDISHENFASVIPASLNVADEDMEPLRSYNTTNIDRTCY